MHSFTGGESVYYSPVWHKKGCPCSTPSFTQCCSKVVPRLKVHGGVNDGQIFTTICKIDCSIFFPVIKCCELETTAAFPSQTW